MMAGVARRDEPGGARVLLLDDEESWTTATREWLQMNSERLDVHVANTVERASELVRTNSYDAVLADVDLGPRSSMRGDVWLSQSHHRFPSSLAAVVTAHEGLIADAEGLRRIDARVVRKSSDGEDDLMRDILKLVGVTPSSERCQEVLVASYVGEVTELGVGPRGDGARVAFVLVGEDGVRLSRVLPVRRLAAIGADFLRARIKQEIYERGPDAISRLAFDGPDDVELAGMTAAVFPEDLLRRLDDDE